ncbi:uncharacterized protein LOC111347674, partial [Stylophora pistillata]|uniref:uncharacterized protein LOC111347674 n=1 Tax=Stylophora pistillata TaxID=50429 RepID=UPI000C0481E2
MRIKLFFSSFALLTVIVQFTLSASVAKEKGSVSKYSLELSEGGKKFKEEITIDTTKGTETFQVPKTSPNESEGNIIYDFKRQVTMIHLPVEKACYMASSVDGTVAPTVLKEALETETPKTGEGLTITSTEIQMKVLGLLDDRSVLSAEMADLCANLPIYVVVSLDNRVLDWIFKLKKNSERLDRLENRTPWKARMKFKLLFSCLALLVVSIHSTFFISEEKSSVSKYSLELSEGGKTFKEEIAIDITKGTETFHVSKTSSDESAGDIIYDFKRQMTMIHMAEDKACYMASSVHETPTPAVLKEALETQTPGTGEDLPTTSVEVQMKVVGLLDDRSVLSDEMADLCANLPSYVVVSRAMNVNDEEAMNPNEMEADVENDEDVDGVIDEGADDFPEISDLDDIAHA